MDLAALPAELIDLIYDGKYTQKALQLRTLSALARYIPLLPHVDVYIDKIVGSTPLSSESDQFPLDLPVNELQELLLVFFRLLYYDNASYAPLVSPSRVQGLFSHASKPIRYLSVRIMCMYLHAADAATEHILHRFVGDGLIDGKWEGQDIDYTFLSLWEEQRLQSLKSDLMQRKSVKWRRIDADKEDVLIIEIAGVLLPQLLSDNKSASTMVYTPTMTRNMRMLAEALLIRRPILLVGQSGSGKTHIALEAARKMGADCDMVRLHLNEQSDAKLLLGMYTTDIPGTFTWKAGVLTTAVKEGRWVLIEDLDRAPTEVLSVILPLVERGELSIPSRGETLRAAKGFQLIATIRTSLGLNGAEISPTKNMLGDRLWSKVHVDAQTLDEHDEIIRAHFPVLKPYLSEIMSVFDRVRTLAQNQSFQRSPLSNSMAPPTIRELLKWCRRLQSVLMRAGASTGVEPVLDQVRDAMLQEAVDCFAGAAETEDLTFKLASMIAQEMNIAPQRVKYLLFSHTPSLLDSEKLLYIGRAKLPKLKSRVQRVAQFSDMEKPFAATPHTLRVLEQVAAAINMTEPVLLVGETGTGKTTVVQHLARKLGHKLTVINLSQQSEAGDLLGGFKPINIRSLILPMNDKFDDLFQDTFSFKKNERYLNVLAKSITKQQWPRVVKLWNEAFQMAEKALTPDLIENQSDLGDEERQPKKRRRLESDKRQKLKERWSRFAIEVRNLESQITEGPKSFAFSFAEGRLVKAARNGDWVLLDEINLASPDTLESIADLFYHGSEQAPSILLSETGELERVKAHADFRIFGAMNPATDVGKRDLPVGLRSRFTEFYVHSPDRDFESLLSIIRTRLGSYSRSDLRASHDIAQLYLDTKRLAEENRIVDGANQKPHYSLRTLTRTLDYVVKMGPIYGLRRAMFEGFSMSFLTLLDQASERVLTPRIDKALLGAHSNARSLLNQTPRAPDTGDEYVQFKQYLLPKGNFPTEAQPHYILTPFVERNLLNLIRASSTKHFPILIQGPTSSGKTSMIEYLAKISGNKFVRINNHEHTDLQEYLGTYASDLNGQLQFRDGVLVQGLREGHWVVLDELNLAPTDVLEALNRLLDDNRELLIPETQEIVRPHANFMLFATQNPPGLYGGRKILSRAFRNRFIELHFDDIPEDELETILRERTQIAPSFCTKIVAVYKELSLLRQSDRVFEQKNSFATLRDLFRWALRDADTREQLAINGFMLLAERVRKSEERQTVKAIIERVMKVKVDEDKLYPVEGLLEFRIYKEQTQEDYIVWTPAMRRIYTLVSHALRHSEPVLLVGETGCGKTTVCQMLAKACNKQLYTLNAHQNSETGDLIGAQRPTRNRSDLEKQLLLDLQALFATSPGSDHGSDEDVSSLLKQYEALTEDHRHQYPSELCRRIDTAKKQYKIIFEWVDGSLVQAMKEGSFFLLDEISLADDSVLERLNSVLEPQRTLLLAEKGNDDSEVIAAQGFQFLATMNPGGDYGKRELSPALRNRFTEIWVPPLSSSEDILPMIMSKLKPKSVHFSQPMVQFAYWFGKEFERSNTSVISVRDVLTWVQLINKLDSVDPYLAFVHGAAMVYIDTLGANPSTMLTLPHDQIGKERRRCLDALADLLVHDVGSLYYEDMQFEISTKLLQVGPFAVNRSEELSSNSTFNLMAPTTKRNAMRIIRALQLPKPILLEGSPGVGKTTLITAISQLVGRPLTRINLSEQTDLMDLFGSDVPEEGAEAGRFIWRDAPFLQAMQNGDWVLLDEMNLASQSVLEGLNACLDHRGEVYVSELDQNFSRHPDFVVFAAQNPHHQGGGRKGLPNSFINRFTVVYADSLNPEDISTICESSFPDQSGDIISRMTRFAIALETSLINNPTLGSVGGPWEFNLRDIFRWLQLLSKRGSLYRGRGPADYVDLVFKQRFRMFQDQENVDILFSRIFDLIPKPRQLYHNLSATTFQVGHALLERQEIVQSTSNSPMTLLNYHLPLLESLMVCVNENWPCLLVGPSGSGKTTVLKYLASVTGATLTEFPLNSDIDTMDLIGGYEQTDPQRQCISLLTKLDSFLRLQLITSSISGPIPPEVFNILTLCKSALIEQRTLHSVFDLLVSLKQKLSLSGLEEFTQKAKAILDRFKRAEEARFEWVDGVLLQALEEGAWLVLDHANLCNSAVLDRLNSLLEPDGFLSINEHRVADGTPRVVKAHSSFRVFLTMDPRHGELSRAMRNRAVELFMSLPPDNKTYPHAFLSPQESSMQRFQLLCSRPLSEVGLGHLSFDDVKKAVQLSKQVSHGLFNLTERQRFDFESLIKKFTSLANVLNTKMAYEYVEQHQGLGAVWASGQPIHALVNGPLVPLCEYYKLDPYGLGAVQNLWLENLKMTYRLQLIKDNLAFAAPSHLTWLQRSIASRNVSRFAEDSTQPVNQFLCDVVEISCFYIQQSMTSKKVQNRDVRFLRDVQTFWKSLFRASHSPATNLDVAKFQTRLDLGRSLVARDTRDHPSLIDMKAQIADYFKCFDRSWQLTTGLSMGRLWERFRPPTPATSDGVALRQRINTLAHRFDHIIWKLNGPLTKIIFIQDALRRASDDEISIASKSHELLKELELAIDDLEFESQVVGQILTPYFGTEFEGLCQYFDLHPSGSAFAVLANGKELDIRVQLFANRSTRNLSANKTPEQGASILLDKLSSYIGTTLDQSKIMLAVEGSFFLGLAEKCSSIVSVPLRSLDSMQTELALLSHTIANSTHTLIFDQFRLLEASILQLVHQLLLAHREGLSEIAEKCRKQLAEKTEHLLKCHQVEIEKSFVPKASNWQVAEFGPLANKSFMDACRLYLSPCISEISDPDMSKGADPSSMDVMRLGRAWVYFAVAFLKLYVPDRPYDPALLPLVQRELIVDQREEYRHKIQELKEFELEFTGQDSNIRIDVLKEDIRNLPAEPSIVGPRPQQSTLADLHLLFSKIFGLDIIAAHDRIRYGGSYISSDSENILRILHRLEKGWEHYNDLKTPIERTLKLLWMGLRLIQPKQPDHLPVVPLLGGTPDSIFTPGQSPWHYLRMINFGFGHPRQALEVFHTLYEEWKAQLSKERVESIAATGLYRYRGAESDDLLDQETELREIFPMGESTAPLQTSHSPSHSPRDLAIKVAKHHAQIFGSPKRMGIKDVILDTVDELIKKYAQNEAQAAGERLIPALLFSLERSNDYLNFSQKDPKTYNFYLDTNLGESRKVVSLVLEIQARFLELKEAWPEHATIQEVLETCDELLSFKSEEPVAKLLTKSEKIHSYIHEWQVVASREYSALALFNELTQLLISWRRLELSTWSTLLNFEDEKCKEDVRSWWFVGYEAIIASSVSLAEQEGDISEHTRNLLDTLSSFLTNTSLGQFTTRLTLLRKFSEHALNLRKDVPVMEIIRNGLTNLIDLYAGYEQKVAETVVKRRLLLEKEIREVILLASWKDTNIIALRDSARRSHHRLFKIIRKYRVILGQPVSDMMKDGIPDIEESHVAFSPPHHKLSVSFVDPRAQDVLRSQFPLLWSSRPDRMIGVEKTARLMRDISQPSSPVVETPDILDSFISEILSTIVELRGQTPASMTKENVDSVKYLKIRKRNLFTETLKAVRHMGMKSNLAANDLDDQSNISKILANTKVLPRNSTIYCSKDLNRIFLRAVDQFRSVREASGSHNDDLNTREMGRSLGYLESFLQLLLQQRSEIANILQDMEYLKEVAEKIRSLWNPDRYSITGRSQVDIVELREHLQRLIVVIGSGLDIIETQENLGGIQQHGFKAFLTKEKEKLVLSVSQLEDLPLLHGEISTTLHETVVTTSLKILSELQHALEGKPETEKSIKFVVREILLWTTPKLKSAVVERHPFYKLEETDQKISESCNAILVAIQDHRSIFSSVPHSAEDSAWLLRVNASWLSSIKALRAQKVGNLLATALETLNSKQEDDNSIDSYTSRSALFASVLPIVEQYAVIIEERIGGYMNIHYSTCKTTYHLAKCFTQVASEGFCSPPEKSDSKDQSNEKLESGTGLGDGEGGEDISKDIQENEDLSELAQEPSQRDSDHEIKDEKDAVDMQEDFQGDMGDVSEKSEDTSDASVNEEDGDLDEEVGGFDDLDPSAVDEKLWDDQSDEAAEDQQGDESKGKNTNEQAAAQDAKQNDDASEESAEEGDDRGVDEDEQVGHEMPEDTDTHIPDGEKLDLPDDMHLDGDKGSSSDTDALGDDFGSLPDIDQEDQAEEVAQVNESETPDEGAPQDKDEIREGGVDEENMSEAGLEHNDAMMEEDENVPNDVNEDQDTIDQDSIEQDRSKNNATDADKATSSDVQGTGQNENNSGDENDMETDDQGATGVRGVESQNIHQQQVNEDTSSGQVNADIGSSQAQEAKESRQSQAFKRLGDALEQWHRYTQQIQDAPDDQKEKTTHPDHSALENADFEHLRNDQTDADTQALGASSTEEAHALDETMAMESGDKENIQTFESNGVEPQVQDNEDVEMNDVDPDQANESHAEKEYGTFIGKSRPRELDEQNQISNGVEDEQKVDEVDQKLSDVTLELADVFQRDLQEARRLWRQHEATTRDLSLSLTEQLRLILAPTIATKMRGDFRTGKRLNIKRIIPYIASQYKRDKIWMRRSIPSKRHYQIMLAIDDSQSMNENGGADLAFETLALVAKSLTMLEVGELSVVSFGSSINVAHEFGKPFTADSGVHVFSQFGFKQTKTDVKALLTESLWLFRNARATSLSNGSVDLWQLQLIISDAVCEDHESIRRLVRQAHEERIMIVFVIVDNTKATGGSSIMDMTRASFEEDDSGEMKLKMRRYMDDFPFRYYLVVGDVKALPSVLGQALRGWFREVVES